MTTPDLFLFVSHVSEDRVAATEIVEELERRGVRCWIAPRDVRPGRPFDDEIADAIDASRAMLLIFSERCNESEYIRREVTVAGESQKVIIPFRIEDALPRRGLRVRLSDLHWIDSFASREKAIEELVKTFEPAGNEAGLNGPSEPTLRDRPLRGTGKSHAGKAGDERRGREAATVRQKANEEYRHYAPRVGVLIASLIVLAVLGATGFWFLNQRQAPLRVSPPAAGSPPILTVDAVARVKEAAGRIGAVNLILSWNTDDDLDLHVRCPDGTNILYSNRRACGAVLDVDQNMSDNNLTKAPVENVYWADASASPGEYTMAVNRYKSRSSGSQSTKFQVDLLIDGHKVEEHVGTVGDEKDPKPVFTFKLPYQSH